MADVKKTLPPSVAASRGVSAILDSCDSELDLLEQEARAACRRLAAATADARGLALWERELGLDIREDLTPEARYTLVRLALEQMDTCTPEKLKGLVGRMAEGEVELTEHFSAYQLILQLRPTHFLVPSLRAIGQALSRTVPAHLDLQLSARVELDNHEPARRVLLPGMSLEIYTEEEIT